MPGPEAYSYPSPLADYQDLPALSEEKNADSKSYVNPPAASLSPAYTSFTSPIDNGKRGGFDVHVYYHINSPDQSQYAHELWERIRREFPELRIYRVWDRPIGPHLLAMFEVNLLSPTQFGAFIPWLVIHRGPLSALVHPNTDDMERDHSQRATWMGERMPLDLMLLKRLAEKDRLAP